MVSFLEWVSRRIWFGVEFASETVDAKKTLGNVKSEMEIIVSTFLNVESYIKKI
jgi:hypothetical protein